mmetsp:Transcript_3356/g.7246  ORF Transcript_3356/g.7246 Transcript_3356/m.7246 type:complete len:265 (-) Transcript_3356:233-1027(-)
MGRFPIPDWNFSLPSFPSRQMVWVLNPLAMASSLLQASSALTKDDDLVGFAAWYERTFSSMVALARSSVRMFVMREKPAVSEKAESSGPKKVPLFPIQALFSALPLPLPLLVLLMLGIHRLSRDVRKPQRIPRSACSHTAASRQGRSPNSTPSAIPGETGRGRFLVVSPLAWLPLPLLLLYNLFPSRSETTEDKDLLLREEEGFSFVFGDDGLSSLLLLPLLMLLFLLPRSRVEGRVVVASIDSVAAAKDSVATRRNTAIADAL